MIISRISTLKRASLKRASAGVAAILGLGVLALGFAQGDAIAAGQPACTAEEGAQIEVKVENVRSSKGLITAVLYGDDPEGFLKRGQRLDRIRVEAKEGETLLCLKAPAEGRYTVALYHDENGNKEFDRNFLGIPSEGYGFSNNPGFRFGKPEQEETLFSVNGSTTKVNISVLYL
ncbi:MAG TPA: DUF2141 domain-containing protein [Kiloniellaceae bacterium]|nr:DUF2141 domain-containing protein [Kiloniellaceae bacterium]HIP78436.1 DUF2141 domain-containing protein [Kiloniellaceae bacterium]